MRTSPERTSATPGRRVPARTCVACRTERPQQELVRLTATADGPVEINSGRRRTPGRGAYLCPQRACWQAALGRSGALARALRRTLSAEDRAALSGHAEQYT